MRWLSATIAGNPGEQSDSNPRYPIPNTQCPVPCNWCFHIVVVSETVAIYMQLSGCPITHLHAIERKRGGSFDGTSPPFASVAPKESRLDDWPNGQSSTVAFASVRVKKQLLRARTPIFQPIPTHVAATCFSAHSCCRWKCLWAPH